ncbi:MAG: PaaI family thioesterase [Syntrophomonadaceae bacterium]
MAVYTDLESLLAVGILKPRESNAVIPCVEIMQREFVQYDDDTRSVTCAYPVLPIFSNPRGVMQGGFICAAFDNTFGMLVYFLTQTLAMATVDLDVNYHKGIAVGDKLEITTNLKYQGKTIIHMVGEAYNSNHELIASATTNIYLLDKKNN